MAIAAGTRLGPYEVVGLLGEGGMGQVYRAHDPRLGRDVAIKTLPAQFAADADRLRRFEQEARAASALNHTNILTVFDVGSHGGAPYLVMELLDGQTLAQCLGGRPLPLAGALDIALQIADGLAAAHAKGITHRDLKPDNVFVTAGGHAKILDFGLAKPLPAFARAGQTELPTSEFVPGTEPGAILGTVGYMSPEQARGEPADQRSDIFSFGCILYEMLRGRPAFAGDSAVETLNAILKDDPPRLAGPGISIPEDLANILARCLSKRPEARFDSAADLVVALRRLSPLSTLDGTHSALAERSLVVLPFADLSPQRDNEYFSDGLTEEIIGDLARIGSLRVISRTTAMSLKQTPKSVPALARELGVRYVLEGSVRRAGNNLRISAQLVDSSSDTQVWSEKFSGTLDDVFDIQERVARAIAEALKVKLTASENRRMAERPITSIQVYDCYLKARSAFNSYSPAGLRDAERLLLEGLKAAGENALLLAGLGRVHFEYVGACLEGEEGLDEAEAFARRALALDAECGPALLTLGIAQHLRGNLAETVRLLKRALQSDPNDADTLWWLVWIGSWNTGQASEAMQAARRLVEVDPGSPLSYGAVAFVHFVEGRFDDALAVFEGQPVDLWWRWSRALILASAGRNAEALSVLEPVEPEEAFFVARDYALLLKFALKGERHRFPEVLRPEFLRMAELDACTAVFIAMDYSLLGDTDAALGWLEKAVPRGYFNYPFLHTHDRCTAPLRGHPRFERLLDVVKRKWEAFRA
jgi:eukaryotic-like serine/threonine-protein kinase